MRHSDIDYLYFKIHSQSWQYKGVINAQHCTDIVDVKRCVINDSKSHVTSWILASIGGPTITDGPQTEVKVAITEIRAIAAGVDKAITAAGRGGIGRGGALMTPPRWVVVAKELYLHNIP